MGKAAPYHHGDLRKALLEAADGELREHGAAGLSLRRVASRAGVSHAAPYRHFGDKGELLAVLVWDTQEAFTAALRGERERGGTPLAALVRLGAAYVDFARSRPERMALMFSEAGMAAARCFPVERTPEAKERYDSFGVLEATVKDCQAAGVLDPGGNSGALSLLWSMVHGLSVIEREEFLASLGGQRGFAPQKTRRLVLEAFRTLVERTAGRPT